MSKTNLVHIGEIEFELVINPDNISYVGKIGSNVFLHFSDASEVLTLRGKSGEALWRLVRASSTTIYKAPADNKNAETLSEQGFGELSNDNHDGE